LLRCPQSKPPFLRHSHAVRSRRKREAHRGRGQASRRTGERLFALSTAVIRARSSHRRPALARDADRIRFPLAAHGDLHHPRAQGERGDPPPRSWYLADTERSTPRLNPPPANGWGEDGKGAKRARVPGTVPNLPMTQIVPRSAPTAEPPRNGS